MIRYREETKIQVYRQRIKLALQHSQDCNELQGQLFYSQLDFDEYSMTNFAQGIEELSRVKLSLSLTLVLFQNLRNEVRHANHFVRNMQQVRWQLLK